MCGIVGYVGPREALPILLDGLRRLEYRGYDSAGVAVLGEDGVLRVARAEGKLGNLAAKLSASPLPGRFGLGHTRWATHGRPSEENAHPHRDASGRIVVIHNGIIENFLPLKKALQAGGVVFASETDTEVVAQALGAARRRAPEKPFGAAVREVLATIRGMYALVLLSADEPGVLYAAKQGPPVVLGAAEGESFVASDPTALLPYTRDLVFLEDGDVARVTAGRIDVTGIDGDAARAPGPARAVGRRRRREGGIPPLHGEGDRRAAVRRRRDGRQQALARDGALRRRGDGGAAGAPRRDRADPRRGLRNELARRPRREVPPRGDRPDPDRGRLRLGVPVPGAHRLAEGPRHRDLAVGRDGRHRRGPSGGETSRRPDGRRRQRPRARRSPGWSTASSPRTRAPRSASPRRRPSRRSSSPSPFSPTTPASRAAGAELAPGDPFVTGLAHLPTAIGEALALEPAIEKLARRLEHARDVLFLGRGTHYPIALEGALKLKEISYLHAEGYPGRRDEARADRADRPRDARGRPRARGTRCTRRSPRTSAR